MFLNKQTQPIKDDWGVFSEQEIEYQINQIKNGGSVIDIQMFEKCLETLRKLFELFDQRSNEYFDKIKDKYEIEFETLKIMTT